MNGPQPPPSPAPAPGLDFGEKAVVLISGILAALTMTAITPVLPLIEKELAHSATDAMLVKQMIGGASLAMVVGAPLAGFLGDRLGLRLMLLICTLLYGIAGTAGLYVSSLELLLASRLLLGAVTVAIQVMGLALINTRLEGNDRAKWMGLHVSIATLSTLAINPMSGALGEVGWRWPFVQYGVGFAVFLVLLAGRGTTQSPPVEAVPAQSEASAPTGFMASFPWHYLAMSLLLGAMTYLPAIYGPFLLREAAGLGPGGIAAVLTGTATIGAAMALLYGHARRSLSVHGAFAFSFLCCGAGGLIAGLSTSLTGIVIGFAIHAMGGAWLVPNIMTSLGSKVDKAFQARATGLVRAAHFLAAPIFVVLVEPFAREHGAAVGLLIAAAFAFVLLVAIAVRSLAGRPAVPAA